MLVNNVVYQQGRKVKDITIAEISEWVGRGDTFVWVALRDPEPAELDQMQEEFGLHDLAVEDARHGHQRPKVEEYGDSFFVVLHLLDMVEGELALGELDIFVGKDFVLSVRSRSDLGFLGVRARSEREPHLLRLGSGFVLYALMDAVVDRYFPVIDALESELEALEGRIFEHGDARSNLQRLYALKQKTTTLRHAVTPLLEAIGKLFGGRCPPLFLEAQPYLRDVYDHLLRINASLDNMRETIGTAIQVNLSMVAIEQSEVAKRLAAWAAIFAVVTALVGIWGMNFDFMPETEWLFGYPLALALIVLAATALYLRFRRMRWL